MEELLCRFLTPPMQLCYLQVCALRTFSGNLECNLQNTQTAPLAAVCTLTLKLGHRIINKNNVCVYFSLILFLSPSVSVPNRILLRCSLRVSEFCYAFVRKRTTVRVVGVWVFPSVPFTTRSAPLSGPRPSQTVTRGGMQLTSNRTRATT